MKIFKKNISINKFDPYTQIISLAKREEVIFLPKKSKPLQLPTDSVALKLLQRIRDEAHRFAITFNRKIRDQQAKQSILDDIPGIGEITKKKLLKTFGSVKKIKKTSDDELLKVLKKKQLKNLKKKLI